MRHGRRTVRRRTLAASTIAAALATLGLAVVSEGLFGPSRSGAHSLVIVCWTSGAALLAAFAGAREAAFARRARTRPLGRDRAP